jgi:hypothetical protein
VSWRLGEFERVDPSNSPSHQVANSPTVFIVGELVNSGAGRSIEFTKSPSRQFTNCIYRWRVGEFEFTKSTTRQFTN